ncbi:MAG: DUF1257 domain-containing protein [Myxococcota bacterium]
MSHFSRVKTTVKNLVSLKTALEDLGIEYEEALGMVRVRGWQGAEELAELVIKTGTQYDIGVRRMASGEYELIADWWALEEHGLKQETFLQRITQRYAYHEVKAQAENQGYSVEEEQVEADGTIRLRVIAWR